MNKRKNFNFLCVLLLFPLFLSAQYTEQDIYAYIEQYQEVAIQKMKEHKIPASITIAQGIFESACGKSRLAMEGNNHFGIKCHNDWTGDTLLIDDDALQECFRKYPTAADSYTDHSLFLTSRKRYANLFALDIMDYASWARTLKADGYATNPQYADRLVSLIERYNLARLDTIAQSSDLAMKDLLKDDLQESKTAVPQPAKPSKPASSPTSSSRKVFTANQDFPLGNSPFTYRKVFENNHTFFVVAEADDTYETIARDVQVSPSNLRKFNDAGKDAQPIEKEIIYIESKAKNNDLRVHEVKKGETLRYISQVYAVQLHYIFKYNNLSEDSIIQPGNQILLKH